MCAASSLLFSSIFCVTRIASSFLCSTLLNIPPSQPRGPRPPPPAQQLQPCSSCYSNKVSPRPVPALSRRGTGPHNPRTQVPSPPHPPAPSLLPPRSSHGSRPPPGRAAGGRGARGGIERRRDRTYDRHTGQADASQRTASAAPHRAQAAAHAQMTASAAPHSPLARCAAAAARSTQPSLSGGCGNAAIAPAARAPPEPSYHQDAPPLAASRRPSVPFATLAR